MPGTDRDAEYARLGVTPTPEEGERHGPLPWDEAARPRRPPADPDAEYTEQGRQIGQHLVDVHDMLRRELAELRDVAAQVRAGTLGAGDARAALNQMALRQNDWALGAFCSRYCRAVASTTGSRTTRSSRTWRAARPACDRRSSDSPRSTW